MALQVHSSLDISVGSTQFDAANLLQVSRLRVDKELIDRRNLHVINQTKIDAHANTRQQVHRFFAAYRLSTAEDSIRSANSIPQIVLAFIDQELASSAFVVNKHGDYIADLFDKFLFCAPERIWLLIW